MLKITGLSSSLDLSITMTTDINYDYLLNAQSGSKDNGTCERRLQYRYAPIRVSCDGLILPGPNVHEENHSVANLLVSKALACML